jgi:probable HAF family extracellular repeat protein
MKPLTLLARLAALVLVLALAAPAGAAPQYRLTDLGTLGGSNSQAFGLNDRGQVVGYAQTDSYEGHAFLWSPGGGMQDLGALGGSYSRAYAINNQGQVVGSAQLGDENTHAFLWTPGGGMQDLHGPEGGYSSWAYGINELGYVVGGAYTGSACAFVWLPWLGMRSLVTGPGYMDIAAYAINDQGQMVGLAPSGDDVHAFLSTYGVIQNLGTLGGQTSVAYGLNDQGQVVGFSSTASWATHAFLWTVGGGMHDLGTPGSNYSDSLAMAVNERGQVVGHAYRNGEERAFLWTEADGMVDLNGLVVNGDGWTLWEAYDINESGQIVGWGYDPAWNERAFLANPVPLPGGLLLLGSGLAGLAGLRRRRR